MKPCEGYFWRSLPLNQRTGSDLFAALFQPQTLTLGVAGIATLLESPYPLPLGSLPEQAQAMARYSICAGPPRVVDGDFQLWTPAMGHIVPFLQQMNQHRYQLAGAKKGHLVPDDNLPFVGGWLGWLGYDVAWEIEKLPWLKDDALPFPVAFWYEPAAFAVLDHHAQRLWLAAETVVALDELVARSLRVSCPSIDIDNLKDLDNPTLGHSVKSVASSQTWVTHSLHFETPQTEFEQAVRRAKAHIRAGDVFQVNHSLRFQARTNVPSWEVYKTLHQINPSPFASYWHTPWGSVVSCSPERLVHLRAGCVQSRPIAGTRSRGKTVADDGAIAHELAHDPKERAEHIMLVDLARNDLGRVCEWGSVQANELMTIERYSHVMHLVSNVIGQLPPQQTVDQLVAALFPGGTITGCPKVRCMEIIEALEPVRRNLFYGSCGYFDRRGRLDLNILIRTLLMAPVDETGSDGYSISSSHTVWGQVGAGIVADSQPHKEWQESLQKAKAQLLALGL